MKTLLKGILLIILFGCLGTGIGYAFHVLPKKPTQINPATGLMVSVTPSPVPMTPTHILIPAINVSADIESVGLDAQGRMDVPQKVMDTAWYNLGVKPGEKGNAVIDGHYDTPTGAPAVFYNIKKLHPGDTIKIIDTQKNTYTFSITHVINYNMHTIPLAEIFGTSTKNNLNLITCGGTWNHDKHEYSERTVVYATRM